MTTGRPQIRLSNLGKFIIKALSKTVNVGERTSIPIGICTKNVLASK